MYTIYRSEQSPLFTCKAHIFQVDPDTRKSWIPLSIGAVNVQIFHDSVKNVYRILSVDGSKVLINTIVTARMSFTKTSQKFCQWVDSRANNVYGLGFANEADLTRFMDKFIEVKEATKNAIRSSSVDARQTYRSESDWSIQSKRLDPSLQLKQENTHLKFALAQSRPSPACGQVNETQELKNLLDNADRRHKDQEQKILQLENQVQRYISQINSLQDRLVESETNNQNLRNELHRRTPQDCCTNRTIHRSPHRNLQQLMRLCDLFESKSNDFNQIITNKSQDLQRLCSQITQTIMEM
ncbi:unnamed protein product [Rotaria sp. Silwood1]|nr:unnamed protein product [Rotaria sp. Silwood1]